MAVEGREMGGIVGWLGLCFPTSDCLPFPKKNAVEGGNLKSYCCGHLFCPPAETKFFGGKRQASPVLS